MKSRLENSKNLHQLHQLSSDDILQLNIDRKRDDRRTLRQHGTGSEGLQKAVKRFFKTLMTAYLLNPSVLRKSGGRDTVGFALFLSSYLTIYKTVLWRMRSKNPRDGDQWNAFVAGSVAGLSILLDRNRDRRGSMTRTLFIRAIHFGSALTMVKWTQRIQFHEDAKARQFKKSDSMLVHRPPLDKGKAEWEKKLAHILPTLAPLLLLSVASMTNIYALFLEPDCIDGTYYKFLTNMSCYPDAVGPTWRTWLVSLVSRFKELEQAPAELCVIPSGISTQQALSTHLSMELIEAVVPKGMCHSYQMCAVQHPTMTCTGNTWAVATGAMTKAAKSYAILYGVVALVWHRKKFEDKPKESAYRYLMSVARSTAFLALHTVIAANSVCLGRRVFGRELKLVYLLNGILASLAILLEQPGRRIEVILYIALRALNTGWQLLLKRDLVRRIPQWDTVLFSLSMGTIMSVYQSRPEAVSKMYRGILDHLKNMPPYTVSDKDLQPRMEKLHQLRYDDLLHLNIDRKKAPPKDKQRPQNDAGKEWQQAAVKRFFKTWITAYIFKYGLDMLPVVLTGKVFKNPRVLRRSGGRDTMSFALFFSSYLTIYNTVLRRLRSRKHDSGDQWNAFVAGSVAGLSILLDRNRDRRASMARTLFIRAIHFGSALTMVKWTQRIQALKEAHTAQNLTERESMLVQHAPLVEDKSTWERKLVHVLPTLAPLLLLSVTTMANIYALFLEPDCVESAYYKFLINMSCFTDAVGPTWRSWLVLLESRFRELENGPAELCVIPTGTSTRQVLSRHLPKELLEAVVPKDMCHSYQLCAVLHPTTSCMGCTWAISTGALTKAVKTYSLLYAVMTLIWHRKKCQDKPKESLYHYFKSVARSTAFLSLYTIIAANSVCLGRRVFGRERKLIYLLNGILASPAILLEQPGRRIEVILYIALRGLLTGWQLLLKRGLVRRVPQWDTTLFSLSMGVVMSVYQSQPDAVSKLYRSALDRVCERE
ncbi:hypothetical protein BGZ93_002732 [Podila epicladia]|nr:hypothetical protein BGZ93_002732 [Podila epicladia]